MAAYKVLPGDTLSGIAAKFGVNWRDITGFRSGNPSLIYPGETLQIPDKAQPQAQEGPAMQFSRLLTQGIPAEQAYAQIAPKTPRATSTDLGAGYAPTATTSTTSSPTDQSSSAQQTTNVIMEAWNKLQDGIKDRMTEFDAKNPFSLDDVLSKKRVEVASRLDPYYNQTLEDYSRGVRLKRTRSTEDERTFLSESLADLDYYTGRQKDILSEALEKSAEGLADAGLLTSGKGMREEGTLKAESARRTAEAGLRTQRGMREKELTGGRYREDLALEEALKRRDIGREKYYQTESGALKETALAQQRREFERSQYIGAPFSSSGISDLAKAFTAYI